jgi:hypothetical protein
MSGGTDKRSALARRTSVRLLELGAIAVVLSAATVLGLILHPAGNAANAPELAAFALSPSRIQLSWSRSRTGGDVRYRVLRNGVLVTETRGTTFTDTRLRKSTQYRYTVKSVDTAGQPSVSSTPARVTTPATNSSPVYPLKVGPTGRYLVDQRNVPFLIVGDSPQGMTVNLSVGEAEKFLANRRAAGFNAMWVNLLCIVCPSTTGRQADGTTYDGIPPFNTPRDLSTPNDAYFARVDRVVRLAEKYSIVLFLNPIETAGWLDVLRDNGVKKSYEYGRYLGKRYRRFRNVIWFHGNDLQSWRIRSDTELVQAVARGIMAGGSTQLHTVELNYLVSSSLDDESWRPLIKLDAVYTYAPTYAELLKEYNRSKFLPTVMIEANYEFESCCYPTDLQTLRRQEYWTMLSGASGQFYGNKYMWQFSNGWQDYLDTPGSRQMMYAAKFFVARPWFRLVPDQEHKVVTSGYGTFAASGAINGNDYVTAARTPGGKLVIAYIPDARTITVDLRKLSGRVWARWFDPTNGTSAAISRSPFLNRGAKQFRPPAVNSDGDGDWVLVLTVQR